jgi:hypothetical protein
MMEKRKEEGRTIDVLLKEPETKSSSLLQDLRMFADKTIEL